VTTQWGSEGIFTICEVSSARETGLSECGTPVSDNASYQELHFEPTRIMRALDCENALSYARDLAEPNEIYAYGNRQTKFSA
jgi:hypothetical protein